MKIGQKEKLINLFSIFFKLSWYDNIKLKQILTWRLT